MGPCVHGATGVVLSAVVIALAAGWSRADDEAAKPPAAQREKPVSPLPLLEARCTDGGLVIVRLLDERLRLKTRFGELEIPAGEIERIDFATRVPEEVAKRVRDAIAGLASAEFDVRDAAAAELISLQERAYGALVEAQNSEDPEVVFRAEQLLEKLRQTVPEDRLAVRSRDVVYVDGSTIGGALAMDALRVETAQFGEQRLKLSDLTSIRAPGAGDADAGNALPDPGSLSQYQGQVGKTLAFRVTGAVAGAAFAGGPAPGAVWGTDLYTLDSSLSLAAVHAGAVQPGQQRVVRVTILGPQQNFQGSTRNGVNSSPWGQFPGAFKFNR